MCFFYFFTTHFCFCFCRSQRPRSDLPWNDVFTPTHFSRWLVDTPHRPLFAFSYEQRTQQSNDMSSSRELPRLAPRLRAGAKLADYAEDMTVSSGEGSFVSSL